MLDERPCSRSVLPEVGCGGDCRLITRRHTASMGFEPTEQARSVAARFGRRIRRARYASGLLQRAVAREAGVSQATISRIELGGGTPVSLGSWIRVATAVGLDWDFVSPSESHHDRQASNHAAIVWWPQSPPKAVGSPRR